MAWVGTRVQWIWEELPWVMTKQGKAMQTGRVAPTHTEVADTLLPGIVHSLLVQGKVPTQVVSRVFRK